jgi:hypothetical protein
LVTRLAVEWDEMPSDLEELIVANPDFWTVAPQVQ